MTNGNRSYFVIHYLDFGSQFVLGFSLRNLQKPDVKTKAKACYGPQSRLKAQVLFVAANLKFKKVSFQRVRSLSAVLLFDTKQLEVRTLELGTSILRSFDEWMTNQMLTETTAVEGDECRDEHASPGEFQSLAKFSQSSGDWSYKTVALSTLVLPLVGVVLTILDSWWYGITWLNVLLLVGMYIWAVLGIELGFHRYLTHRSLKTNPFLRAIFVISGCIAGHGQPIWWCAIHRRHHQYSDHHGDPHSPNLNGGGFKGMLMGCWHSHIGWMFQPQCTAAYATHFTKDLINDRMIRWIDRYYVLWTLVGLAIPAAIGGLATQSWHGAWTGFLWGGLTRMFFDQHALWWGIVTVCHRFGYRTFRSDDQSTNHWLIAILFLGDGWHNNHHAFPSSAKVGLAWWEYDPTWFVIRILKRCGLVWDLKVPSPEAIEQKRLENE